MTQKYGLMEEIQTKVKEKFKTWRRSRRLIRSQKYGIGTMCWSGSEQIEESKKSILCGIEFYCQSCGWFGLTDLYDPWSYSTHAFCEDCGQIHNFGSETFSPAFSFYYLELCYQASQEYKSKITRYPKFAWTFLTGLNSTEIPQDRDGKTWSDLESMTSLMAITSVITTLK